MSKNIKATASAVRPSNKKSYISELVRFENDFEGSPMGFTFRMFKCFQALSEQCIANGATQHLEVAIETLGRLVENSFYESGLIRPEYETEEEEIEE